VHSVSVIGAAGRCTVSVELRRGDDQALAIQEGVWATAVVHRLTAEATLQAIAALDPAAGQVGLEAVAVAPVGTRPMAAVVLVEARPDGEQAYAGSALVRAAGEHDAVARAVLDATTRRLSVA
jgi:hypothetical protein